MKTILGDRVPQYFLLGTLARIVGSHPDTIHALVGKVVLTPHQIKGKQLIFRKRDVLEWLKQEEK
jgi:hypothetical protein